MSIQRLDSDLRAAGIPIDGVSGSSAGVRVDYKTEASAAQRTEGAALVAAFDWNAAADLTWAAKQQKTSASTSIDRGDLQGGNSTERLVRALAMVVLDEVNILRAAAVLPARTTTQLVNAIKAKIAATGE